MEVTFSLTAENDTVTALHEIECKDRKATEQTQTASGKLVILITNTPFCRFLFRRQTLSRKIRSYSLGYLIKSEKREARCCISNRTVAFKSYKTFIRSQIDCRTIDYITLFAILKHPFQPISVYISTIYLQNEVLYLLTIAIIDCTG